VDVGIGRLVGVDTVKNRATLGVGPGRLCVVGGGDYVWEIGRGCWSGGHRKKPRHFGHFGQIRVWTTVVLDGARRCKRRTVIASGLIQCVSIVLKCLVGCLL
jgi:hypothetical protein